MKKRSQELDGIIKMNIEREEEQLFGDGKRRLFRDRESRVISLLIAFDVVLFLLVLFFTLDFTIRTPSIAWVLRNAAARLTDFINLLSGRPLQSGLNFFVYRLLMTMLAGAALAAAGAVYQAVFHNPMASPTILGVQSGGGLGAALFTLFFVTPAPPSVTDLSDVAQKGFFEKLFAGNAMQFAIILFCFISLIIVILISKAAGGGRITPLPMILCGTVFSSLCSTVIMMIQTYFQRVDMFDSRSDALGSVMTGSFETVYTSAHLVSMAIPIIVCIVLAALMGGKLNILSFAADEARTMGVNVDRARTLFLILATLMTAVVVAFCGILTFVGLVAPFLCRRLVGVNNRYLIPASALMGAALTIAAYSASYMIGYTALVNIMLSVLGGLVFIIMIAKNRGISYE